MSLLPEKIKTFQEAKAEYDFIVKALSREVNFYNTLLNKGFKIPSAGSYYQDFTFSNVNDLRNRLVEEINYKYVLEIIASFEAKLVFYFRNDIKRNSQLFKSYKSEVPPRYRKGTGYLMIQHFIDVFRINIHPIDPVLYSNFKELIDLRNWLAHGRAWDLTFNPQKFDLDYSLSVISFLTKKFPNSPNYFQD